jgi:hypothetical protein
VIEYQNLKDTQERLFFIVGTSRSGSTLLQSMLNTHSQVVIPPETHFFHSYSHLNEVYHEDSRYQFRERLLDFWYDQKTRIRDLGLEKNRVQTAADSLDTYTPVELFLLHLTLYRQERKKEIIGEKTPRHILHVPQILKEFPDAKIISLFRDPRAAAYSEIKAHFGSPSVIVTSRRWQKYVAMHQQLENELSSDQYMMLQYRDLVESPKEVLQRITDLIDVSFEEQMLNYYNREEKGFAEGEKEWKSETFEPLKKNKNEEWKTGLSTAQVALVEKWAGSYLKELGYDAENISISMTKNLLYHCLDMGRSAWSTITNARYEGYHSPRKFNL